MQFITFLLVGCSLVAGTILEVLRLAINPTYFIWLIIGASVIAAVYGLIMVKRSSVQYPQLATTDLLQKMSQCWIEMAMAGFVVLVLREMRLQDIEFPSVVLAAPVVVAFWLEHTVKRQKNAQHQ